MAGKQIYKMIDKKALMEFVGRRLDDYGYYLVDLTVGADNEITVTVDSDDRVDIDHCVELTRAIEEAFPREDEDYSLEVGSAGLTSPFRVKRQYDKNIGNEVEVLTRDGRKLRGILDAAGETAFTVGVEEKVRKEGMKRPVVEIRQIDIPYEDAREVTRVLRF